MYKKCIELSVSLRRVYIISTISFYNYYSSFNSVFSPCLKSLFLDIKYRWSISKSEPVIFVNSSGSITAVLVAGITSTNLRA
nr:MAG TPA: hypothetical protein [Caudoviricetes sp.]